jgi:1-acyl-sn-glycerol-3-phosphate acyltransferase
VTKATATAVSVHRPPARFTLFTTPVVSPVIRLFAWVFLKIVRWRTVADHPREGGFVFTAAPHTSNWDAFYMLAVGAKERIAVHWLAKASLFKGPFRPLMRWLGGIPVDRTQRTSLVDTAVAAFAAKPDLILGISPEGTRQLVDHWKSGFYRIAQGAGVPVVPGFLDFGGKVGGAGAPIVMTGDPEEDLSRLRAFYQDMKGRIPANFDPAAIRLRPATA